jgi:hypothetical protein
MMKLMKQGSVVGTMKIGFWVSKCNKLIWEGRYVAGMHPEILAVKDCCICDTPGGVFISCRSHSGM